ncbi:molybdate ABC transporter permease subunit [Flavobacterium agrisoli]|uniref:Molybdenum transport system permease n=1 Tax=Flavobacterium agrisoli TaxID=2793066 RepID=A0A934PNY9_9FLAO|nr:molybdate ABC transporter permease subunit [Flavobacterium agrisoli]MBK0371062.1 molybdate ABC transporter permease subunit [Flavobacterium agrisoli]
MIDFAPLYVTLKLALTTTFLLFLVGLPLAYWLAYSKAKSKIILEAIVSLPLVLPPSVLGFYLLLAFSPENAFGHFLENYFDIRLVFTFSGLVVASVLYSLPFMVQPLQSGFQSLPPNISQAAYTLGKNKWQTLIHVQLPNMKTAMVTAIVLSFAHTIGEFGVVLMVGGSIPNETKVVSIAVFDEVTAMNYETAAIYSSILLVFSFLILIGVYGFKNRFAKISPLS